MGVLPVPPVPAPTLPSGSRAAQQARAALGRCWCLKSFFGCHSFALPAPTPQEPLCVVSPPRDLGCRDPATLLVLGHRLGTASPGQGPPSTVTLAAADRAVLRALALAPAAGAPALSLAPPSWEQPRTAPCCCCGTWAGRLLGKHRGSATQPLCSAPRCEHPALAQPLSQGFWQREQSETCLMLSPAPVVAVPWVAPSLSCEYLTSKGCFQQLRACVLPCPGCYPHVRLQA